MAENAARPIRLFGSLTRAGSFVVARRVWRSTRIAPRIGVLLLALATLSCQTATPGGTPVPSAALAAPGGAVIPSYPDIKGTWTAVLNAIYTGEGPHTLDPAGEEVQMDYLRLTITVEVQEGPLFFGTARSAVEEEPVVGSFREGGLEAIYITRTGRGRMWIDPEQPDVIEVCGGRGTPHTLMALCGVLERTRSVD